MTNESMERASTLKRQIDLLLPRISEDLEEAKKSTGDFARSFIAEANKAQLDTLQQELKKHLIGRGKEIIDIHLTGSRIGHGSAPVLSVGHFLSELQSVIERIGQSMIHGPKERGKVPNNIKLINQLRLEGVSAGSFRMSITGDVPESGMFSTLPETHNDNLLTKSIVTFFDVLQADDPVEEISSLGSAATTSFKDFFNAAVNSEINIETSWIGLEGEIRKWDGSFDTMAQISTQLDQIEESEGEPVTLDGRFSLLDVERNRFIIRTAVDEIIKGIFTEKAKTDMQSMKVDLFEEKAYRFGLQKETMKNKATHKEKIVWTLMDVEPLD